MSALRQFYQFEDAPLNLMKQPVRIVLRTLLLDKSVELVQIIFR